MKNSFEHNQFISRLTYENACKRIFSNSEINKIKELSKRYGVSFHQFLKNIVDRAELLYL